MHEECLDKRHPWKTIVPQTWQGSAMLKAVMGVMVQEVMRVMGSSR